MSDAGRPAEVQGGMAYPAMTAWSFGWSVLAMGVIVVGSNVLVQYPINEWLTWGGLSYPVVFLVCDLINRRFGPAQARRVAYVGFVCALAVSVWAATPRIALASGTAYLCAQLLDIHLFDRLRHQQWWRAPLLSGTAGAALDTALFFSIAFVATGVPWVTLMAGDLAVKLLVNLTMLLPFRALMWNVARPPRATNIR